MSKIISGLLGLVVADAVGVPYEFKKRGTFNATDMTGYGTYNMPVGTWSDDSSMTIATVDSIVINKGKIDTRSIMTHFAEWLFGGLYTPYGTVFDVGNTTRAAIQRFEIYKNTGFEPEMCGGISITDNGNGSLMRILPLAFVKDITSDEVANVSALTHAHAISKTACRLYVEFAQLLMKGLEPRYILRECFYLGENDPLFGRLEDIWMYQEQDIKSTGYVVDTLEAALWCLTTTDNYKDCVLKAVNLGGDTDTIAAVAGGLAGILYADSDKGIPPEWIEQLAKKDEIISLFESFERVVNNG